jgi:molybdenum cofactor synthesis domain-containing protein
MTGPRALRYAEARTRVLDAVRPLAPTSVPLLGCDGRALREAIVAPHSLPPFRNSAMDGYAVRAADLAAAAASAPVSLRVVAVLPAGRPGDRALAAGEAARIMTGAMLPSGADAIVPFEECEQQGAGPEERCVVRRASGVGDHVREAGADVVSGSLVFEPGRELSAHDLALLAALGRPRLDVGPRPRVAVLSTGDELLDVDQPLRPGAIRDSNLPMMRMLLESAGCEVAGAKRLPDDAGRVATAMREALATCDVVLTLGGVSEGDRDPVKLALRSLPEVEAWRVAMRPGRPQAFGTLDGKLVFGLPGNPASVACVFEVLVRPALRALQGHAQLDRPRVPVRAAVEVASRAGRTDFVRVTLAWRDGTLWATPAGVQLSGHLSPQARAHALLVVPEEAERLAEGEHARAFLWREPGLPADG